MKILVTGGAGFIGSNIVDEYILQGHNVVVVDNLSAGKIENLNKKVKFYKVDIRDNLSLKKIFQKEKFDIINHHAAQIDVRKSVENPQFDAVVNIVGTLNLLQLSIKHKIKKFIFASSGGTIYGECKNKPAPKENVSYKPEAPYGCSKLAIEYYLGYYNAIYGLKFAVLRYANVYGPRQDPFGEAGVVAIFANRMLKNEDVYIFGDGKQMRDFVFVKDVVNANVLCLKKDFKKLVVNIGTGEAISVNELFYNMKKIIGYSKEAIYKPARKGELFKSYLNNSLANKELSWKPKKSFYDGLKETIEFFKSIKD
ncbi:MAG: SDR family NAD(P)-dependent oxidoreductase [Endomicrobiia bacterium]